MSLTGAHSSAATVRAMRASLRRPRGGVLHSRLCRLRAWRDRVGEALAGQLGQVSGINAVFMADADQQEVEAPHRSEAVPETFRRLRIFIAFGEGAFGAKVLLYISERQRVDIEAQTAVAAGDDPTPQVKFLAN